MATTISDFDMNAHSTYALRTVMNEQFNQQLRLTRLSEVSNFPPQTQIVDIYPRLNNLDIVLGIISLHTPWAYFFPPQHIKDMRRSPFSFSQIAPSFGLLNDHDEEISLLESIPCKTPEEQQQKGALLDMLKELIRLTNLKKFVIGKMCQYVQG